MRHVRWLVIAVALVAFAPSVQAQDQGQGQGGRRNRRMGGNRQQQDLAQQLKEPLGLTEDQVTKVKAIDADQRAEMQKAMGGDRNAMRDAMTKLREKTQEQVKALLTDDQKPKYDEYLKNRQNNRGGRGGPGGNRGGNLYDRAAKELTLTDEEKASILPLVKSLVDARDAERRASDKAREELRTFLKDKKGEPSEEDRTAIQVKLKALRDARDEEQAKVAKAREALRAAVSPGNEAKLVSIGVL